MVRLRNREVPALKNTKNPPTEHEYDPVRLYQQYIHNLQITPKEHKANWAGTNVRVTKKPIQHQPLPTLRSAGGVALDKKCSKVKNPVRSKPSIEIQSSRTKVRPKTAISKKKPVANLEDYEVSTGKKVSFEADEIECFFDALKETVEEVIQSKLSSITSSIVDSLSKKIEEISNKSEKVETTFAGLVGDLNNKITYYGEEHSRHFRYICMKLEYDKIFYQHINNLIQPETSKPMETVHQSKLMSHMQESSHSSQQTTSSSQHPSPTIQRVKALKAVPTCSHNEHFSSARETTTNQHRAGWLNQAGDSVITPQLTKHTDRQFNHSQSGPFQRIATCQTSDDQGDVLLEKKAVEQSKLVDIAVVSPGNDKAQLGIKEFLDTLKVFQSNLSHREAMGKSETKFARDESPTNRRSTLSLMDTDDSSSECIVSNGISMLSSEGESTPTVEKIN